MAAKKMTPEQMLKRIEELKAKPLKCDDCGSYSEVRQWRDTHYRLCVDCALRWLPVKAMY